MRRTLPIAIFRKVTLFGTLLSSACSFRPGSLATPTDDATLADDAIDAPSDSTVDGTTTALAIDNVSLTRGAYQLVTALSHSVNAGDNRLLLVALSTSYAGTTATGVLYGTTPLTFVGAANANSDDGRVELWRLIAPPVGTANVTVTVDDQSSEYIIGVTSLHGANQTAPLGTFTAAKGNNGNPTLSVAAETGDLVLGILLWNGAYEDLVPAAGQDERWNETGLGIVGAGSFKPGAATTTFTWSANSQLFDFWTTGGVAIHP